MRSIFAVALLAASSLTLAADVKAPSGTCEGLASAFEGGLKTLASIEASGFMDNSAARESNRLLAKVVETNLMQMTLSLMVQNKCPAPKPPVSEVLYSLDASRCSTAKAKAALSGDRSERPECDMSKWKRITDDK